MRDYYEVRILNREPVGQTAELEVLIGEPDDRRTYYVLVADTGSHPRAIGNTFQRAVDVIWGRLGEAGRWAVVDWGQHTDNPNTYTVEVEEV